MSYFVKLKSRYKELPNEYLSPFKSNVKWSKERARKEAKFAMEKRLWKYDSSGALIPTSSRRKDYYTYRVIKMKGRK